MSQLKSDDFSTRVTHRDGTQQSGQDIKLSALHMMDMFRNDNTEQRQSNDAVPHNKQRL